MKTMKMGEIKEVEWINIYSLCVRDLHVTCRQPHVTVCFCYIYNKSDSHLPQLRQLFEDPRRLKHSEFIVVKTPRSREGQRRREQQKRPCQRRGRRRRRRSSRQVSSTVHTHKVCRRQMECDSQFGGVLGDVIWYFGEFLVGTVHCGALTAALLWASQVSEAVPSELTAVILRTCPQSQARHH